MDNNFHQLTDSAVNDYGFGEQSPEESQFVVLPESNAFEIHDETIFPSFGQPWEADNFAPFYNVSSVVDFPDDHESYPVLKYLNQILMEEQPTVCNDPLALQATEKSLYAVLGNDLPFLPDEPIIGIDQNVKGLDNLDSDNLYTTNSSCSPVDFPSGAETCLPFGHSSSCSPVDSPSVAEPYLQSGEVYEQLHSSFELPLKIGEFGYLNPLENSKRCSDNSLESLGSSNLISSMFTDSETMLQFKKGLEEGSKFLTTSTRFFSDFDNKGTQEKEAFNLSSKFNEDEGVQSSVRFSGKKHAHQDYSSVQLHTGRCSKQSAFHEDEIELAETFEKIVLFREERGHGYAEGLTVVNKKNRLKSLNSGRTGRKTSSKKGGTDAEAVDLIAFLTSCSQSVAASDIRTASKQLTLIRQHASSTGNSYQRLAVPFAKGLEARLNGTGPECYATHISTHAVAAEELKAFRVYLCAPFKQIFCFFADSVILEAASNATKLHIIDFGISYGFQWPTLIKQLSVRPGGPPNLRITGIDLPESGFRPEERLEATGWRLAEYCRRYDVPFEYHAIASSRWEDISIEELKITRNEVLVANCQWRFKNLFDEPTEDDCPRDAVLNLIRDMKPDIFIHDVINGQFGSPFFVTRFREALLFFSTIFDLLDQNLPRHDLHRLKYEQDFMGDDIVNIVACEGRARVDRPETYKQWQIRYERAGFKLLPLNKSLMKDLQDKVKEGYHKDFMFDDNGYWMMQGWKGKTVTAASCLVPV